MTTLTEPEALATIDLCPFCNDEGTIEVDRHEWNVARVICSECGTCGPFENLGDHMSEQDAIAAAITSWNRRPNDTPSTPAARMLAGEGEAKPVAWMYDYPGNNDPRFQTYEGMSCREEDDGMVETPLYAHPPAAEPVGLREFEWPSEEEFAAQTDRERIACLKRYYEHRKAATPARTDVGVGDSVIAAKAREALGAWLAWPDAPRDGPRPVTNEQVESWLHGLPNRLAALSPAPDRGEVDK